MSLFHKNINEIFELHNQELEQEGFLTGDWYWDRQKISALEKIDKRLLEDLILLYKSHASGRERYQKIIEHLKGLI